MRTPAALATALPYLNSASMVAAGRRGVDLYCPTTDTRSHPQPPPPIPRMPASPPLTVGCAPRWTDPRDPLTPHSRNRHAHPLTARGALARRRRGSGAATAAAAGVAAPGPPPPPVWRTSSRRRQRRSRPWRRPIKRSTTAPCDWASSSPTRPWLTAAATDLWVGLGVGEPTSGGMLCADTVTVTKLGRGGSGSGGGGLACRIVDRPVPSARWAPTPVVAVAPSPTRTTAGRCQRGPSTAASSSRRVALGRWRYRGRWRRGTPRRTGR